MSHFRVEEDSIVERKDDSLWFDIFKNHESSFKLHKGSSNGWAKLTSREPKKWMAQARRPCCDSQPHRVLPWVLCSSLHFLLGEGRETNMYLVLTTCCARGNRLLDAFPPQGESVVYDALLCIRRRKVQPGKSGLRHTNYIMYIHSTNIHWLIKPTWSQENLKYPEFA